MGSVPGLLPELTDAQLVRDAKAGSADSFGELAARHRPSVLRYLLARGAGNDAEDIAQETLLLAMERIATFRDGGSFEAWLIGIASNRLATRQRMRQAQAIDASEQADPAAGPAAAVQQSLDAMRLWELARRLLPPRQYEALRLRTADELSVAEVAARMGISRLHARVLLFRARRRLAKAAEFVDAMAELDGRDRGET